jgi:hypothetical protein
VSATAWSVLKYEYKTIGADLIVFDAKAINNKCKMIKSNSEYTFKTIKYKTIR